MPHLRFDDSAAASQDPAHANPMPCPPAPTLQPLHLKGTVLTSHERDADQCYVFEFATSPGGQLLAASLSNRTVKLYQQREGGLTQVGQVPAKQSDSHWETITHIEFPFVESPHTMFSSSSDGYVVNWDARVGTAAQVFNHRGQYMDPAEEIWTFAASAGTAGNLLVTGGNLGKVYFWDVRKNDQPLQMYEEAHTEAVTQVVLPSSRRSEFVVTASVDGLICVLNSNKNFEEDEDTEEVLSVGDSVAKIGFYGPRGEKLWCLTHTEELSLWNWEDGSSVAMFKDTRNATAAAAAASNIPLQTQYLIRCEYSAAADQLCLIGGAVCSAPLLPIGSHE